MPISRLPKSWQNLSLSKKRKAANDTWLKWGSEDPEDQYEPSATSLSLNVPMIHAMYEEYKSLDTPVLKSLIQLAVKLI